jgi:hypothetical protein
MKAGKFKNQVEPYCYASMASCSILCLALLCFSATSRAASPAPVGVSNSDWSGIRAAYEAKRHDTFAGLRDRLRVTVAERVVRKPLTPLLIDPLLQYLLKASNPDLGDQFGWAVAVSRDGSTAVIGAPGESSNARGVNGNQDDNSASSSGAAYIFVRDPVSGIWSQQAYLKASNADPDDNFGSAVAISSAGNRVVIGAPGEASKSAFEADADNSVPRAGAAYIFTLDGVTWSQAGSLKGFGTVNAFFGASVALTETGGYNDKGMTAVGAPGESSNAIGANHYSGDTSAPGAGAVYTFGGTSHDAYLKASNTDAGDGFGYAVAVSGNTVVAGAIQESSIATGVNGDQSDNSAHSAGAAYVFLRTGTGAQVPVWSQQAYLKASNTTALDERAHFGTSVALDGDTLVIGAPSEASNATGVNGNQADHSAPNSGAAYIFTRAGTT